MSVLTTRFKVWKTLELTIYGPRDWEQYLALVRSLNETESARMGDRILRVSDNGKHVLRHIDFERHRGSADIAKVSLKDLDLGIEASRVQIVGHAETLGLQKIVPWIGAQLRLDYLDQPDGQRLIVGMEPTSVNGSRDIFLLDADNRNLWLRAVCGNDTSVWRTDEFEWLFMYPIRK